MSSYHSEPPRGFFGRIKRFLIGSPKDFSDTSLFHKISLIPFLAWIGLGADGLSSSSYGPEEAFKTLGQHTYLAIPIALLMCLTVFVISAAYRRIIEEFPHGGGGYVVASKLLGHKAGVISGCALIVDYILTITVSVAAAGDALFSFLPLHWHFLKIFVEIFFIIFLTILNIRGAKESVLVLTPIFIVFLLTHVLGIFGGIFWHLSEFSTVSAHVTGGFQTGLHSIGAGALGLLLVHAYSMGGGTYTGIEAVSNGLPIMREPKVKTGKRTMVYMAVSLAFTAAGLLFCYLLWGVTPVEGKTMNAVLFEKMATHLPFGSTLVVITLLSEGLLLVVAAQAGFIDGPRVLANMAVDSWFPRRFAALSERLTTGNGILIMGVTSLLALLYTHGDVSALVVMYSINVFLTFSLSIFGMLKSYIKENKPQRTSGILIFSAGFILCATILVITMIEKFSEGGWITLLVTALLVMVCLMIRGHYHKVAKKLRHLQVNVNELRYTPSITNNGEERTAAILVAGYGGLGLQTLKSIFDNFPGVYKNFMFISVGVIDSGVFKGEEELHRLEVETENMLSKYVVLMKGLGVEADYRHVIGTEVVEEGFYVCSEIAKEFPHTTFFTGKVIFDQEQWFDKILHNETAFSLQKRLQIAGLTMVILPANVN
ncbi:MAG: APC family permease [Pseudobdellovibrionaceae bacterium]